MSGEYSTATKLPTGYTQVEYLESTGTQYIDTGIKTNTTTSRYETKINPSLVSGTIGIFGTRNDSSANQSSMNVFIIDGTFRLDWLSGAVSSGARISFNSNTEYAISITRGLATINNVNYTSGDTTSIDGSYTFYVGSFNNAGSVYSKGFSGKIYYSKLYNNNILVFDGVPCYRKSDNEIGMYDLVSNTFFTNAGTGTFKAGAEIVPTPQYGVIPVADYKDICDAVREKTHTDALMLPPEVAAKIRSINPTPTPGEWVRPDGWPDLDAVNLTGFDGVYLTYDLSQTEGYGWIGLFASTADRTSWTVERGHLEAGQFVAERTEQVANNGFFREPLDDTYGTIQLWRVSASGHITELKFVPLTATNSSNMNNNLQPCVERVGRLPYVVNFSSSIGVSQGNRCCGTMWMQHDKLLDVSSVTNLKNAWQNCYSLQSLNLSGWDVSSVTDITNAWNACYNLQSLDISGWDVSGVIYMSNAWNSCYNLQSLDLSGWDTGSVTTLPGAWNSCYNLQSLNLSGWDVSSVINMAGAWQNCSSLQSLNLSGWDVSSVANMSATWANCYNLQSLDLSGWDVSSVTNMVAAWQYCYSLQSLDLSGWDVTSVTNMSDAWKNCYSLVDYWPSVISINQNYDSAAALSIASLLRIIDSLPVVTEARTLTLGQTNKLKLTAEQIAVATQKGWTVA